MKRADVEARLAKVLSELKRLGYSYSKLADPRIKMLSTTTALYSVVAVRCKEDGSGFGGLGSLTCYMEILTGGFMN